MRLIDVVLTHWARAHARDETSGLSSELVASLHVVRERRFARAERLMLVSGPALSDLSDARVLAAAKAPVPRSLVAERAVVEELLDRYSAIASLTERSAASPSNSSG